MRRSSSFSLPSSSEPSQSSMTTSQQEYHQQHVGQSTASLPATGRDQEALATYWHDVAQYCAQGISLIDAQIRVLEERVLSLKHQRAREQSGTHRQPPPMALSVGSGVSSETETNNMPTLTPRQREVLILLSAGASIESVAATLLIAPATARTHRRDIYKALDVSRLVDAIRVARQWGVIPSDLRDLPALSTPTLARPSTTHTPGSR
ncbi:MAG TPA: LuxR C-terminal-related transcriptional regulator, partial [Ktedonobacterales bacterium]|nr:LuxR C-terminal-related transcriptional regulator [Ktedonobacterales bacterium]